MSVISNRHNILPFVAGKSAPLTEQRLAKVGYKTTKKQTAKFASVCASVPMIDGAVIELSVSALIPAIRGMLETAQDGIIRSLYESSGGTLSTVSDEEINIPACIAFMAAESAGSRLSAESIGTWFDGTVADILTVTVADKLSTEDSDDPRVVKAVKFYRDILCLLTGKSAVTPLQLEQATKALNVAEPDDDMSTKLRAKIRELSPKTVDESADVL